jgi:hypothetical protein
MSSLPAPIAPPDIAFVTLCMGVRRRGVRAEHTDKVTAIPGSIQMGMEDMCSTSICAFAKHVDTAVHRTYSFVDDTTPARVLALYKHYRVRPVFPFQDGGDAALGARLPKPHASWPIPYGWAKLLMWSMWQHDIVLCVDPDVSAALPASAGHNRCPPDLCLINARVPRVPGTRALRDAALTLCHMP